MSLLMNYLGAAEALVRETFQLGVELAKIAGGNATVSPAAADRRFADPAWSQNPMYRQLAQVYLAWAAGVGRVADDLETNEQPLGQPRGAQARLRHGRCEPGARFPE